MMLARVERRELARFTKRIEHAKARQTAQLETIASEAYDAWLHSKTPQVTERITSERVEERWAEGAPPTQDVVGTLEHDAVDQPTSIVRETKTHQCDSSLLNQVRGALADIRDIWGINAPVKSQADITSGGQPLARPTIVEIVRPAGVPEDDIDGSDQVSP